MKDGIKDREKDERGLVFELIEKREDEGQRDNRLK